MKKSKTTASILPIMQQLGQQAKAVAPVIANASTAQKNLALQQIAKTLVEKETDILQANALDLQEAQKKGMDAAFLDRLQLTSSRIHQMEKGVEAIADLADPVGKVLTEHRRPNGLHISQVAVPLGTIGIIYESRPNVTLDAAALCIKSGNAVILRGGSESFHSSRALVNCIWEGLKDAGLPEHIVQLVPTTDREAVGIMLHMAPYIDVIIPRGGKTLCKRVQEESRIPTLLHLEGNCHTYIHTAADEDMAIEVVYNAKLRRPGICGATESLVIDEGISTGLLPKIINALTKEGCEIRGDEKAQRIDSRVQPASPEDWDTEYLDKIISVKIISGYEEAIDFINLHSSHHTDAIITKDMEVAKQFLQKIDSAIVMHNSSTQFADGGEFGMGAEIGIATGRLHARGPVGVAQLTTYKYVVRGNGQIRPK